MATATLTPSVAAGTIHGLVSTLRLIGRYLALRACLAVLDAINPPREARWAQAHRAFMAARVEMLKASAGFTASRHPRDLQTGRLAITTE